MTINCPVIYVCPNTTIPRSYCEVEPDSLSKGRCDDGNILIPYCPCESQEELISTGILIAAIVGISVAFIVSIVFVAVFLLVKNVRLKNRLKEEQLNKMTSEVKQENKAPMPDFVQDSSSVYCLPENIYHTVEEPNEKFNSKVDIVSTNYEIIEEQTSDPKLMYSRVQKKRPDSNIVHLTENCIYNIEI